MIALCNQRLRRGRRQQGYLLLAVSLGLIALSMFALSALELGHNEAILRDAASERTDSHYAAQAAVAHARWQLAQTGSCSSYQDIAATDFGDYQYSATISPDSGSPVTIVGMAYDAGGRQSQRVDTDVPVLRTAETLVLRPGELMDDTSIDGADQDDNRGDKNTLRIGSYNPQYGLMRIDLGQLPQGVKVLRAELQLEFKDVTAVDPGSRVYVYPMLEPWVEDEATFGLAAIGVPWSWPAAYAQHDPVASIDLSVSATGAVMFDITRLAQAWAVGEQPNYGMALIAPTGVNFAEFRTGDTGNENHQPQLTITYACECGVVCVQGGSSLAVAMFVGKGDDPKKDDRDRRDLLESWGYSVSFIDDGDDSGEIAAALAGVDVAYVSSTVDAGKLLGELANLPVGLISENAELLSELGFSDMYSDVSEDSIDIVDVGHYITGGFLFNERQLLADSAQDLHSLQGSIGLDVQQLALLPGGAASLAVLEFGGVREDSSTSVARRVNLPWASTDDKFKVDDLADAGRTILRRSLEWAAASAGRAPGYLDEFAQQTCVAATDYSGSLGGTDWSASSWQELLDDDLPCSGSALIADDPVVPQSNSKRLVLTGDGIGIEREVDLTGYGGAWLRFDFRRSMFLSAGHQLRVYASIDGAFYDLLGSVQGNFDDPNYFRVTADLTPYISPTTHIKFETAGLVGDATIYLDRISISRLAP